MLGIHHDVPWAAQMPVYVTRPTGGGTTYNYGIPAAAAVVILSLAWVNAVGWLAFALYTLARLVFA